MYSHYTVHDEGPQHGHDVMFYIFLYYQDHSLMDSGNDSNEQQQVFTIDTDTSGMPTLADATLAETAAAP